MTSSDIDPHDTALPLEHTSRITVDLSQHGHTITLQLRDWPAGPLTLTHNPDTGTVLHVTGAFTHVVDGDYTLIVNGAHTTFVHRNVLLRTLGHAITFTSKTIQQNPLLGRVLDYILGAEARAATLLRRLLPEYSTLATVADKQAQIEALKADAAARVAQHAAQHESTCCANHTTCTHTPPKEPS